MTITINLNNLLIRLILTAIGLLICVIAVDSIRSHFLIRNIADRRIVMNLDVLNSAAIRFPDSSRVQLRLAEAELEAAMADISKLSSAQQSALRVANLSPWDYRGWRLLSLAKESDGNAQEALNLAQVALNLAPNHSEVNWALANLLLRQNRQAEASQALRRATATRADLLPVALDLVWQASGNDIASLDSLVGEDANAKLVEAQFLTEQGQTDAAINVFRLVDSQTKLNSANAPAFVTWLIQAKRGIEARQLWLEIVGEKGSDGNGVWNGSFEHTPPKDFGHFDWTIKPSNYARIGFDRSVAHSGSRSLKLVFAGQNSTKLENEIQQLVVLKANTRYRLECFVKAVNLVTQEGPRIAVAGQNGTLAVSLPIDLGSTDWQRLFVEFMAPPENGMASVTIVRMPQKDYDGPTKGTVWFDDFRLTQQ
ncbi:MAG: tetratricopeptide repeat protein [Blastocatellia bacterium]